MKTNETIEKLRRQSKLSPYQVAEMLDISYSTYRRIERGVIRADIEKLKKLAELFRVKLGVLTENDSAYNAQNAHSAQGDSAQVRESSIEWAYPKGAKKSGRIKPVRLILEIDPDYEPDSLPKFLQELEEMLERYSGGHSEN